MKMTAFIVIRVRATVGVRGDIQETMKLVGLNRPNHAVVLPESDSYRGMLQKMKDYVTWGEADEETLAAMISARGKIVGDYAVTDDYIKEKTEFGSIADLSKAIIAGEYKVRDVEGMKPVFRLHPPVKGFEGNKHSFKEGGALGYRGEAINDLVKRMI
ncbi:LSU ribosomal protein L30P [Thermoplasmatales archaeon BRNA1]|nr:LSU ribosomal protein L30P [Thermoplasmatales archaeon BRNA1]